jgi:YVTN family beta-propeller protein
MNIFHRWSDLRVFLINNIGKRVEIHDHKHKLFSIVLVSIVIILMLVSIACASPYTYISNYGSNVVFVIDTATNQVTTSVNVEPWHYGVAITHNGTKVCFRTGIAT